MDRRAFLRTLAATGVTAVVPPVVMDAARLAQPGTSPHGPLLAPDENGLSLPEGFVSRIVARSGQPVGPEGFVWHRGPDGGATFVAGDGWIYVSNSEQAHGNGGVGAIRFGPGGEIADAYSICSGTYSNCSGGATPWGTWLSCEEYSDGQVWECDPTGAEEPRVLPAMGVFKHEAAAVDGVRRQVYMTEDEPDGCLYRFTPVRYPDLSSGVLEVAVLTESDGTVAWVEVPDPSAEDRPTRRQVTAATRFRRGEGAGYHDGTVYFTTTGDNRVWGYDAEGGRLAVLYDADALDDPPLRGVDNVAVSQSGDVLVAEDGDNMELVVITADGVVAPLLRVEGDAHADSEMTGPAFDPSGTRLYFSSQRGYGQGVTFEVSGPFQHAGAGRSDGGGRSDAGGRDLIPLGLGALGIAAVALGVGVAVRRRQVRSSGHEPVGGAGEVD